jgi:hypothetical protein
MKCKQIGLFFLIFEELRAFYSCIVEAQLKDSQLSTIAESGEPKRTK